MGWFSLHAERNAGLMLLHVCYHQPNFFTLHFLFPIKPFHLLFSMLNKLILPMSAQLSLEPWTTLAGKVVMVTGASSGLGRDFTLDLARAGCRVVLAARRVDRLQSLCDEINRMPSSSDLAEGDRSLRAVSVELDVAADGAVIDRQVQKAWDAFGHLDALINNAGVRGNWFSEF